MLETFISCISTLFEFISVYYISHIFLKKSLKPNTFDIIACIVITATLSIIPEEHAAILWIVAQFSYMLYVFIIGSQNIIKSILLYALIVCSVLLAQFVMVFIISITSLKGENLCSILGSTGSLLLIILLFKFTPLYKIYDIAINSTKALHILIVNTYLIFFSTLFLFKSDQEYIYSNPIIILTVISLIFFVNIGIFYYELRIQKQEHLLDSYEKHMPIYESLISDIRSRQHEYTNRLQSLATLPYTCKDYDSLCKELDKYTTEYSRSSHAYPLLQINMPLLAASLYNLMNRASTQNITVHFDIASNVLSSKAPEYILSDISCILLQNAIEASNGGDYVYVRIESDESSVTFEVRNPSATLYSKEELASFFKKHYSSKKTSHNQGLGLYYLKNTIDQYHGFVGNDCFALDGVNWISFKYIV